MNMPIFKDSMLLGTNNCATQHFLDTQLQTKMLELRSSCTETVFPISKWSHGGEQ